jgi:hypothetical protein
MIRAFLSLSITALVLSGSIGCTGGDDVASNASREAISAGDRSSGTVSDEALADLVRRAPDPLTSDDRSRLIEAAIAPTVTTARLKMVNELAARGLDKYRAGDDGRPDPRQEVYDDLAAQVQVVFCVAPRDVVSSHGGQTLLTSIGADDLAGPVVVKITGTAAVDYRLEFTMSNHRLSPVLIPAGSSAEATAKRLSDAINAEKEAIENDFFEERGIGPDTGEYGGSDGMYSSVSGDTLTIDPAING